MLLLLLLLSVASVAAENAPVATAKAHATPITSSATSSTAGVVQLWNVTQFQYGINGPVIRRDRTALLTSENGALVSVDAVSGAVLWNRTLGGYIQGTPLVRSDDSIVVGAGHLLYALRPDGICLK
jgi:outer membrane protein assembly factor BamB